MRSAIFLLHRQGHALRKIAQDVGVSRNTVREVIASGQTHASRIERDQALDPHRDAVRALYVECRGNIVRVQEELLAREKVVVAYSTLTRFCRQEHISDEEPVPTVRIVTGPGEEMQHDTSPYVLELGGKKVRRQCASLVLGYSRRLYMRFYPQFDRFTCKLFLTEALRYMGGACGRCVIDNTSVVLACGAGRTAQVSPEMEAFEKRFRFKFLAHELMHSDRKGKIERPYDYIEGNFLVGRYFKNDADLNQQALDWIERANLRHIRDLRASPRDLFVTEAPHMTPLPLYIPEVYRIHRREADAYGRVHLHRRRYSVPNGVIGKTLVVRESQTEVIIMDGPVEIARHKKLMDEDGPVESVLPGHGRRPHRINPQALMPEEASLKALGAPVQSYLEGLKSDRPGRSYRWSVKRLHRLIGHYPATAVVEALAQALEHRLWDARRIEGILLQNLAQDHFQLPLLSEDYEKNPEFDKGSATPPADLSVYTVQESSEEDTPAC